MGLDTSYDCWHGAYSAFHRWRSKIAECIGIPLDLMEGFYNEDALSIHNIHCKQCYTQIHIDGLPLKWDAFKPDVLHILLDHSDCDGYIPARYCAPLADRLEKILPMLPDGDGGGHIGVWKEKTQQFINGLRAAAKDKKKVEFS